MEERKARRVVRPFMEEVEPGIALKNGERVGHYGLE